MTNREALSAKLSEIEYSLFEHGTVSYEFAGPILVEARAVISAMGGVKVKPLEWHDDDTGEYSRGVGYEYCVGFEDDANGFYFYDQVTDVEDGGFATIEAAKAAAQSDYEKRILSALTPSPVSVEGWQTIERAPKSKEVLLYIPDWGIEAGFREASVWTIAGTLELEQSPTHWMPLPAAPQEGGE